MVESIKNLYYTFKLHNKIPATQYAITALILLCWPVATPMLHWSMLCTATQFVGATEARLFQTTLQNSAATSWEQLPPNMDSKIKWRKHHPGTTFNALVVQA